MLARLNKIKNWQAAVIITILGFAVYFIGLKNQFQGDDLPQIINNIPVHSISHIKQFFDGGTFYNPGYGLGGDYYRPLMTTAFSMIYTLFGARPIYYHIFQLCVCIASAIFLYLIFRFTFRPILALFLALIFLIHPIDSQVVFAIPSMQDALFFFFGILALWLLIRFKSLKSLMFAAICLFLSLLAKETAVLFILMAMLYLFWFDERRRLYQLTGITVISTAVYMILRMHAIGLFVHPLTAPIDNMSLTGRLMTAPSIAFFYISKFIFPWRLASGYDWTYSTFSFRHVLLPLILDVGTVAIIGYIALLIKNRASKSMYYSYMFYMIWAILGILLIIQIIPLDLTACEIWFYFSMAGVLGMLGVVFSVFPLRINRNWLTTFGVIVIVILGFRTSYRGLDWRSQTILAYKDVAVSSDNYLAYTNIATNFNNHEQYYQAKPFALQSVNIYPSANGYNDLGLALMGLREYTGAKVAYTDALKFGINYSLTYENLGALYLAYGSSSNCQQFLLHAVAKFPDDSKLWMYLAIVEDEMGDNIHAKIAISNAMQYGQVPEFLYSDILSDQAFKLNLAGVGTAKVIDVN